MAMLPLSVLLGEAGAATTYDTANAGAITTRFTNAHAVGIVQDKGFLMTRGNVNTYLDGDTAIVNRKVQLQMGCLGDNYKLTFTPEVDELKRRCSTGTRALSKGGAWNFSAEDVEINPVMYAMLTGLTLYSPAEFSGEILIRVTEALTVATNALPALATEAEWFDSVVRLDTDAGHNEVATLAADGEFKYTIATKVITFNTDEIADGVVVEVTYLYRSNTNTAGIVLYDDGTHFPSQLSAMLSFLAVDDDNNAVGRIIVEIPVMRNTAPIELGGANQELSKITTSFVIDGIPTFNWQEFA